MGTRTRSCLARLTGTILALHTGAAFASPATTTGLIAGHVLDHTTGAGIRFANVVILNTTLGANVSKADGAFTLPWVPAGMHRVKAGMGWYEPEISAPIEVVPGETTYVEFRLVVVPITIYRWSACGPTSEYRFDAGPEAIPLAPNVRIRTVLGLRPPIEIDNSYLSTHGGEGSVLRDSCGSLLNISWDGVRSVAAIGDTSADHEPRRLYLGMPADRPGAQRVPVGSALEAALIDVMRAWVDTRVPHAIQDSLVRIAFDADVPRADRKQLVGTAERWSALAVAQLARILEVQRAAATRDSSSR